MMHHISNVLAGKMTIKRLHGPYMRNRYDVPYNFPADYLADHNNATVTHMQHLYSHSYYCQDLLILLA